MYLERNPFKVSKALKMHERCVNCNTKFKIEPSFFYGAMYVSYPVGIAFATIVFVTAYFIIDLSLLSSFLCIVATMVLLLPIIMRLSRNIWINFFFSYDPDKANS